MCEDIKDGKDSNEGAEDMGLAKNSVDLKASFKKALIEVQEIEEGNQKSRSWKEMMSDIEKDEKS